MYSDCPDGTSLIRLNKAAVRRRRRATRCSPWCSSSTPAADLSLGDDMYGRLPSPIAVLTLDQNPGDRRTQAGRGLPQRRHLGRQRPVDHLRRQPVALEHTLLQRGVRARRGAKPNAQLQAFCDNLYGKTGARANPTTTATCPKSPSNADGTGSIKKHYCLGRISHELIQVMPDQRTALMGDDATNGGLFMFVADREADLSAGTLAVGALDADAVGRRRGRRHAGNGSGWATPPATRSARCARTRLTVQADIMDVKHRPIPADASRTRRIFYNGTVNWVRVKPGMNKAADLPGDAPLRGADAGASMGF